MQIGNTFICLSEYNAYLCCAAALSVYYAHVWNNSALSSDAVVSHNSYREVNYLQKALCAIFIFGHLCKLVILARVSSCLYLSCQSDAWSLRVRAVNRREGRNRRTDFFISKIINLLAQRRKNLKSYFSSLRYICVEIHFRAAYLWSVELNASSKYALFYRQIYTFNFNLMEPRCNTR